MRRPVISRKRLIPRQATQRRSSLIMRQPTQTHPGRRKQ